MDETILNLNSAPYEVHPGISGASPSQEQVFAGPESKEDEVHIAPTVEAQQQAEQAVEQERANDRNIRKLRSDRERLERKVQELEAMQAQSYQKQNQQYQQTDSSLGDDDIVEGKHLKQLKKQQDDILREQQRNQELLLETKLRAEFPDILKVLSDDNLETLNSLYPEIAQTIGNSSNIYTKGKAAYQMMKQLGIYKEDKYENDRRRAQDNANKPRPLTSASLQQGDSPLSHANAFANGFDDTAKAAYWNETKKYMRNSW